MNVYDIGDTTRISTNFSQGGIAQDPGTVALRVKFPDATISDYAYPATIVRDSVGNYHVDLAITQRGPHRYRWVSTGAAASAEEGVFQVRTRRVT